MNIKTVLSYAKEMLFPKDIKCIFCDSELSEANENSICNDCQSKLPFNDKFCSKCGRFYEGDYSTYYDCNHNNWFFDKARSVFLYDEVVKNLIYRLKYNNGRYLAEYCAFFLQRLYISEGLNADLITFVPMHKKRQRARGYNQAQLIALELGKLLELPVKTLLIKSKETKNMSSLKKDERKAQIVDSFSFNEKWNEVNLKKINTSFDEIEELAQDFKNKHILLIDDLFTTGSTSNECAKVLKSKGCGKITILTLASQTLKVSAKSTNTDLNSNNLA